MAILRSWYGSGGRSKSRARPAATVVLPVPPLPVTTCSRTPSQSVSLVVMPVSPLFLASLMGGYRRLVTGTCCSVRLSGGAACKFSYPERARPAPRATGSSIAVAARTTLIVKPLQCEKEAVSDGRSHRWASDRRAGHPDRPRTVVQDRPA